MPLIDAPLEGGRLIETLRYVMFLHDLVSFLQFKKREKHRWSSIAFNKVADFEPGTLLKVTLLHGCFSRFLNCTNCIKLRNESHIIFKNIFLNHC